ncbi:hypothetical protein [uncultured Cyclobacterium sp.]|uniref:hypothetical protein n=1 Tax=uncultured Cyclobacterium sp. TaxID=453820 RepID=UPI0030EEE829
MSSYLVISTWLTRTGPSLKYPLDIFFTLSPLIQPVRPQYPVSRLDGTGSVRWNRGLQSRFLAYPEASGHASRQTTPVKNRAGIATC